MSCAAFNETNYFHWGVNGKCIHGILLIYNNKGERICFESCFFFVGMGRDIKKVEYKFLSVLLMFIFPKMYYTYIRIFEKKTEGGLIENVEFST